MRRVNFAVNAIRSGILQMQVSTVENPDLKPGVCLGLLTSFSPHLLKTEVDVIGGVAQLVERRTGTPLRQLRFPGAARDFFLQSQLSVQTLLRCPHSPRVQSHALTSVRTLKIPSIGSHTVVWTHENTSTSKTSTVSS